MGVALLTVNRVAVFVHPGQLKQGCIHLIAMCDAEPGFDASVEAWSRDPETICLYDGPPQGKQQENQK